MRRHYSLGALKLGRDGTTQRNSQFHVEEAISHSEQGPSHGDGELYCVDSRLEKEGDTEAESVYQGLEANTGRLDDGSDVKFEGNQESPLHQQVGRDRDI